MLFCSCSAWLKLCASPSCDGEKTEEALQETASQKRQGGYYGIAGEGGTRYVCLILYIVLRVVSYVAYVVLQYLQCITNTSHEHVLLIVLQYHLYL